MNVVLEVTELDIAYATIEQVNGIKYLYTIQFLDIVATIKHCYEVNSVEDTAKLINGVKKGIESYFFYDEPIQKPLCLDKDFWINLSINSFAIYTEIKSRKIFIDWIQKPSGLLFNINQRTTTTP